MSLTLLLSLFAICLSIGCVLAIKSLRQSLRESQGKIELQQTKLEQLNNHNTQLNHELHEMRSGNFGLSKRLKALVQDVEKLQAAQQSLAEQDPQVRFYSNAAKLINQGASIEDVMQECGIPSAEAELLFNLHRGSK
ncbi:DUF2802 domain-containing protein [Paraglaciecola aestuariivivens]